MKKYIKIFMCLLMAVAVVGCGGKDSTEKQEAVVNNFFTYLKEGDIDKISSLWVEGSEDLGDLDEISEMFDMLDDTDLFGQTFVDEAKSFTKYVFENTVVSYEIKEVKKADDKYTVTVNATIKDLDAVDFESDAMSDFMTKYQEEHLEEIQKIATEEGEEAALQKIYTDIAPELFGMMKDEVKNAGELKEQMTFTLEADGDNWLISEMVEKEIK